MHKDSFTALALQIVPLIVKDAARGRPIAPQLELLATLRFYATGCFLREVGDLLGISEMSASRIVHKVTYLIAGLRATYIKFPSNEELPLIKRDFYNIAGMPGVIGCVDGSHVPIKRPITDDYEEYRCRKGFFSINVQGCCNSDLEFTNIVARWKGSTHDARIFENSRLFNVVEMKDGFLLGDSGYAQSRKMFTPFLNPQGLNQQAYNRAHTRTRNCVERTFGVWKARFQAVAKELRFSPSRSCSIIVATAVLHNYLISRNEPGELLFCTLNYHFTNISL
jgi:hypothetical protein